MPGTLLDSDTLSHLMRRHALVVSRAREYQQAFGQFTISVITRYEILSGLKAKQAIRQVEDFKRFCAASRVLPLTEEIADVAADVYADLHRRGELFGDADILIAATALAHGLVVATGNLRHLGRVKGLDVVNWLEVEP